jgi:hypothetical protein
VFTMSLALVLAGIECPRPSSYRYDSCAIKWIPLSARTSFWSSHKVVFEPGLRKFSAVLWFYYVCSGGPVVLIIVHSLPSAPSLEYQKHQRTSLGLTRCPGTFSEILQPSVTSRMTSQRAVCPLVSSMRSSTLSYDTVVTESLSTLSFGLVRYSVTAPVALWSALCIKYQGVCRVRRTACHRMLLRPSRLFAITASGLRSCSSPILTCYLRIQSF